MEAALATEATEGARLGTGPDAVLSPHITSTMERGVGKGTGTADTAGVAGRTGGVSRPGSSAPSNMTPFLSGVNTCCSLDSAGTFSTKSPSKDRLVRPEYSSLMSSHSMGDFWKKGSVRERDVISVCVCG